MTTEKRQANPLETHKYAFMAALYAQEKDVEKTAIALKKHCGQNYKGIENLIEAIATTPEATLKAAGLEGKVYQEAQGKRTVESIIGSNLEKYFPKNYKQVLEATKDAMQMSYNDFDKMIDKAKDTIKNKHGEYKEGDIKKARETIMKYQLIHQVVQKEMQKEIEPIREEIESEYLQKMAEQQYAVEEQKKAA